MAIRFSEEDLRKAQEKAQQKKPVEGTIERFNPDTGQSEKWARIQARGESIDKRLRRLNDNIISLDRALGKLEDDVARIKEDIAKITGDDHETV